MKLKNIFFILGFISLCSCEDYLDVVPDNVATLDHVFADKNSAEGFLFTCYNSLPNHSSVVENPAFMAGGEFLCLNSGYIWHNDAWNDMIIPNYRILSGQQNTNSPYGNFWDGEQTGKRLFVGIRNCNILFENINKPVDMTEAERTRWVAEARFLRAYYHFWLFQMYGPIPVMETNLPVSSTPDEVKVYREPVEKVVDFIVKELDLAAQDLPDVINDPLNEMGRITKPAALAIKARVLALAASPLFNGNPDYAGFKDDRGLELFPSAFDKEKWKLAADAALEAINVAEASGHKLYYFRSTRALNDTTKMKMNIRGSVTDNYNEEIIWGAATNPDQLQRAAMPSLSDDFSQTVTSEMAVPMEVVDQFYSSNGVPINEDRDYDYINRYKLRTAKKVERFLIKEGETTAACNFDREIRFYASLAFDRGIIYGAGVLNDAAPATGATNENTPKYVKARRYEMSGQRSGECYSITGYFPKKLVHWESAFSSSKNFNTEIYHLPIVRLADLYLLYAEAQTEYQEGEDVDPAVYTYIDAVRKRASLKGVIESWTKYSTNQDKPKSKTGLLSIIHQERLIELAFEGQRFWDMRRWKTLEDYLNKPLKGWNIKGETADDYYTVKSILETSFSRKNYLWPIKQASIEQNPHLVQNPGWK